jgi:hypothetical protein
LAPVERNHRLRADEVDQLQRPDADPFERGSAPDEMATGRLVVGRGDRLKRAGVGGREDEGVV